MENSANFESSAEEPQKSAKQLEKEAKKAAKLQKLQQKLEKKNITPVQTKDKPEVIFPEILYKLLCLRLSRVLLPG